MVTNLKYRNILAKIRLNTQSIELGRHRNVPRNVRKCILCDMSDIEDEYHFILVCPSYNLLRQQYIPRYYHVRPSMLKLVELIKNSNIQMLNKLACFYIKAFKERDHNLNFLY